MRPAREDAFVVTTGMGSALYLTRDGRVLADFDPHFRGAARRGRRQRGDGALVLAAEKFAMPWSCSPCSPPPRPMPRAVSHV